MRSLSSENPASVNILPFRRDKNLVPVRVLYPVDDLEGVDRRDDGNQGTDSARIHPLEHIPYQFWRKERSDTIVDGDHGPIRDLFQGVPYGMEAGEPSGNQCLRTVEVRNEAIVLPKSNIVPGKDSDYLDVRDNGSERFDRPAENRNTSQIQKLFRNRGTHPDAASGGHDY